MLNERILSFDNKTFCNKAYCITSNEEQLILANEWRIIAMDEVEENAIYRSGRIPVKNASFQIENTANVTVCLRCIGANDDYILCLIFDENDYALITLWSLNEHVEILLMRFAFIYFETTSSDLFDLPLNNNEILYLATTDGTIRTFDLLKIKTSTKVQNLSADDTVQQVNILPDEELTRLVCLSDDIIAISTSEYIVLFERKDFSKILQKIKVTQSLFSWSMTTQEDHNRILITVDSSQQFIMIYRQDSHASSSLNQMKIDFRSNVDDIKLIQTITIMDNDEKKKSYVLILLDDETIQLLDINQLSQASLEPVGLFTRIKNYNVGEKTVVACEYEVNCPIVMSSTKNSSQTIQLLHSLQKMHIEHIAVFDNDQYYVLITGDQLVYIYSVHNFNESLFEYDLKAKAKSKSKSKLFSVQSYHSNIIIFMFMNQFIFLQIKFDHVQTTFHIQSEQILSIPNRELQYSLEFTPNKRFLILKQSLNLESNTFLNDFRIFTCDDQFKITPIKDPVTYIKSKLSTTGKIIAFMTYVAFNTRPELWIAYQGTILRVRLPSNIAELDVRSDYHCWMRHSLALYDQTTEKLSLSIEITSLAVQSPYDSRLASGADDGSIVVWNLTDQCVCNVLESIHTGEVTDLKFDTNSDRLFSSSVDRTLAIWSPTILLRVLRVCVPIDRITLFASSNILLAQGKFWGFDRLMMFYIGNGSSQVASIQNKNMNTSKESKNDTEIEASEMASWAL